MSPQKRALKTTVLVFGTNLLIAGVISACVYVGFLGLIFLFTVLFGLCFWHMYQISLVEEEYIDLLKKSSKVKAIYPPKPGSDEERWHYQQWG